eukprot:Seg2427.6 transcript_id=Seg2427.6/GoldUCD/mRNA.D3Y31 product="hypothetical protein" protein_id=Seg2427.6/GoldUCD/D3Y31
MCNNLEAIFGHCLEPTVVVRLALKPFRAQRAFCNMHYWDCEAIATNRIKQTSNKRPLLDCGQNRINTNTANYTSMKNVLNDFCYLKQVVFGLGSRTVHFDGHCLLFSVYLNYSCDGWPVMKCVYVHEDLHYNVKIGKILCELDENFPHHILKSSDLLCLLKKLLYQKFCRGCVKNEAECLGENVYDQGGSIVGRVEIHTTSSALGETKVYRSSSCKGTITGNSAMCEACKKIDQTLRKRVSRAAARRSDEHYMDAAKSTCANLRYLTDDEKTARYNEERRRRVNAEKRERYAKWRLKEEKEAKEIVENQASDFDAIFKQLTSEIQESNTSQGRNPPFEDPNMEFFWALQRELNDKQSHKWHPRYA